MYGTSGPRIELRFFATTKLIDAECGTDEWLAEAYEGTAMGGVGTGHRFFHVWVKPDESIRYSTFKLFGVGWMELRHKRTCILLPQKRGLECVTWEAPRTSSEEAFYYARVLEIPTKRWSTPICENEVCPDSIEQLVRGSRF